MNPERIPQLVKDIDDLKRDTNKKHEQNEQRFDKLENTMVKISTEIKIIMALIIANGALNFAHFFLGTK